MTTPADIARELSHLREMMATGLAELRSELAALRSADASVMSRLDALERVVAAPPSDTPAPPSTAPASTPAPAPTPAHASLPPAAAADDAIRHAAEIQAKALYDEADALRHRVLPGLCHPNDCKHHALPFTSVGTRYVYPCCGAEFRHAREAEFSPGCVRSEHAEFHHNRISYHTHTSWLSSVRKSPLSHEWFHFAVPDIASGSPKFVVVGTSRAGRSASDTTPSIFIAAGRGLASWGSRMAMFSASDLDALVSAAAAADTERAIALTLASESGSDSQPWSISVSISRAAGPAAGIATYVVTAAVALATLTEPTLITFPFQVTTDSPADADADADAEAEADTGDDDTSATINASASFIPLADAPSVSNAPLLPSDKLAKLDHDALAASIPPPLVDGTPIADDPPPPLTIHKSSGSSELRIKAAEVSEVSQSLGSDSFVNFFTIPLKIMNPSSSKLAVVDASAFYLDASGAAVPVESLQFAASDAATWEDSLGLTLDTMGVAQIKARLGIRVAGACGSTYALRARAAPSLPQPLTLRLLVEDIMGEDVAIDVEYANSQLGLITKESWEKSNSLAALAFVYADACAAMTRHYVAIARANRAYVLATSHSTRFTLDDAKLNVMAFNAHCTNSEVLDLPNMSLTSDEATTEFAALVHDPAHLGPVYGFRVTITTPDMRRVEHIALPPIPSKPELLRLDSSSIQRGQYATCAYHINELHTGDWFAVVVAGTLSNNSAGSFWYEHPDPSAADSGTIDFVAPDKPGEYRLRFFPNSQLTTHTVESDIFAVL
ncbi:uncharacterized protein AMSG_05529 [Thecamonas trahens ATCC 50062]|uniref:Uncharacterized protein n=1 Tax=Thecamonas trahens ATCC 50062 TaxID=461836 RepID=A0A0L0DBN2_THETB|nr:hypothetical protein AMSG_05529 [Thecamonas trahens ATCC 50062]KNC49511.1 hypothetical protein AMSG_05529 [Thecamonas trahens ATCC 50062]|eukprot:XP_013757628.1 hypothetical protein AMSG_05529 [Thecamonas trahens ATCC 50062]